MNLRWLVKLCSATRGLGNAHEHRTYALPGSDSDRMKISPGGNVELEESVTEFPLLQPGRVALRRVALGHGRPSLYCARLEPLCVFVQALSFQTGTIPGDHQRMPIGSPAADSWARSAAGLMAVFQRHRETPSGSARRRSSRTFSSIMTCSTVRPER